MFQARKKEFVLLMLVGLVLLSTTSVVYAPPDKILTVNIIGKGSVTLDPPGGSYPRNTVVTLTADPDDGESFIEWQGDLTGSTNPDTVTMSKNKTVTALFTGAPPTPMPKGPYLLYNGVNTEMVVLWQLDDTQTCTLEWGLDTNYTTGSTETTEFGNDHQHKHIIPNLAEGTKYFYRVTDALSNEHTGSFYTAPLSSATSLKFLAYGDTRSQPTVHDSVCAEMINAYTADSGYQTLLLNSGDWCIDDSENAWTNDYFNVDSSNAREVMANVATNGARGNHEGGATNFDKYWPYPYVGVCYWSFDYGPAHVAVVDQYGASYSPGSDQYNWLDNDLANSTAPWKFIILHHPGWTAGYHANNTDVQELQPLCVAYDVAIVFAGHNHYYAHCDVEDVKHITTGGGGAPLYSDDSGYPNVVYSESTYHYCEVDIQGTTLTFRAVNTSGQVIDTFQINNVPGPPGQAYNPNPGDGANNVNINAELSWKRGASATSHDVYFGTDNPPPFIRNQAETTYNPGTMPEDTTHYWQIDEVNAYGTTTGAVWSFTTGAGLTAGLVGCWPMDDGTGDTVADDSGNGNTGTRVGNSAWVTGKFGGALDFTGGHVNCGGSSSLRPTSALTVSAWVKADAFAYYASMVANVHDTGSVESGYSLHTLADGQFGGGVCGSDGTINWIHDPGYSTGTWYHVMLINTGSQTKVYVNGSQAAVTNESAPIDYSPTSLYGFEIGRYADDNETHVFDGIIDDVGIWDRELTSTEIAYLYNNGTGNAILGGEPCTPTDMHIEAVVCSELGGCGPASSNGQATVTIYDDCGNPVTDALVDGTFTGDFSETFYDVTTNGSGEAVFTTIGCIKKPAFTFTVTDVTDTLPYDSNDDVTDNCSG